MLLKAFLLQNEYSSIILMSVSCVFGAGRYTRALKKGLQV